MTSKLFLLTGGGGFIGSHLSEILLGQGHRVRAMDIGPLESNFNLRDIADNENYQYLRGDIRNATDINDFFDPEADAVFHLASVVGVNLYMEDPLSLIDVGILGTRNLLGLCIEHNVRMLFTSTSEVYGKNPAVPWSETSDRVLGDPTIDRWSYSTSKAMIEHMLFGAHRKFDWPFSVVRFFNVYGPRQNPIFVVSRSVWKALRGETLEMYDGGEQTRCFSYIEDIVQAIVDASQSDEAIGEVFNVGNDVETPISQVFEIIKSEIPGVEIKDIDTSDRFGALYQDIPRRVPDTSKAQRVLGLAPKVMVEEGVLRCIKWARDNPWYTAEK